MYLLSSFDYIFMRQIFSVNAVEKDTIKKRKRKPEEEVVYFKKFPEEAQKLHEEKYKSKRNLLTFWKIL